VSLITPAVYREHDPGCSLGDDALQRLIDANEDRMVRLVGPHSRVGSPVTTVIPDVYSAYLHLSQPIGILSLAEESFDEGSSWTSLTASDYELQNGGLTVHRLGATRWGYRVRLTYIPLADLAERVVALLELVGADVSAGVTSGGIASESIGSWSQTFASGDYGRQAAKDRILSRLRHGSITFA